MAIIRAFRGLRPDPKLVEKVAAPPYDVLSSEEAREMALGNEYTFLHVNKPEIDLDSDVDLYDERVYAQGAANLQRMIRDNVLRQDEKPCLYVYRQQMGRHVQTGLVAGASVDEYDRDRIKKHEQTRADKEDDRTRHVATLNANTGPVFLTYKAVRAIDAIMAGITAGAPEYDFTSIDGIRHFFWVVADPAIIGRIEALFGQIDCLYVADGHHRSASASRVQKMRRAKNPQHTGEEEYNFFLSVIFPHDQMLIMDYNRVVRDLNNQPPEQLLERVKANFTMAEVEAGKPKQLHDFGMYINGRWFRLTAKAGTFPTDDPVRSLDVSILQENLLAPILGIADPRKDKRIDFVGGIRGLQELERLVQSGKHAVAFALYPTSIEQLMAIADAGRFMPPKSTWFEPKLKSGLVIHLLD
ncbi:MAG: DUF1015 domain-containing protein [Acidobacteria bacterium]|nr:DUF1015 domain-containing protein [Acidobacteriota bacterium]